MDLVRDVLDKQLVDLHHDPIARVDGITLVLASDRDQPRVACIEAGATVLADRLNRRLGRCARAIAARWGLCRGRPTRIPWFKVVNVDIEIEVDVAADQTPARAWEHWLRKHFTRHLSRNSR